MEHVVFWSDHNGVPAFSRVPGLGAAVELVERLRNSDGIADATVHALTDVPVAFRAYYVAEVEDGATGMPEPAAAVREPLGSAVPLLVPDSPRLHGLSPGGLTAPPALSVVPDMVEEWPAPADLAPADLAPAYEDGPAVEAQPDPGDGGSTRSLGLFA